MTARQRFNLKNRMLVGNVTANLVAAVVIINLLAPFELTVVPYWQFVRIQALSSPILFLLGFLALVWYERPMRRYIDSHHTGRADPSEAPSQVLRRLLNEPFFAVVLDLTIWILAAGFWTTFFWQKGEPAYILRRTFLLNLNIGLITSVIAFFLLEHIFQKVLAPFFFPHGRIYEVPGTLRISIRVRLAALLFACNLVPFFATILVYLNLAATGGDPADILERLGDALTTNSLLFMGVGVWLWALVGTNLSRPFASIIRSLTRVREGHFDGRVQVTSNDEIGYTGDVVNQMTEGLKEREQMRLAMMLAREVQQNLLPGMDPCVRGLDIAGTSIYCDETGGDYYDYIHYENGAAEGMPLAVVVGDVSGHGVPSALLMATARALLRQRLSLPGDLADVFNDVNRQLTQDVGDSGQFMTLMGLAVNPVTGAVVWVRAGHDPAILYDPGADRFVRLAGPGVALGADTASRYTLQHRQNLAEGSIILMGTDGIWEACSVHGEMFGKERIRALIKSHAGASAKTIRDRLVGALKDFCGSSELEDDITMVVIKLDRTAASHQNAAGQSCEGI
jgi:sigma-B regulation protein RsbU (phosphoserine phosphatase)